MLVGTARPRDLVVGHVAHEPVPEGELVLTLDRGDADGTHELPVHELVQLAPSLRPVALTDRRDRPAPEDPPDNRGVVQQRLELGP